MRTHFILFTAGVLAGVVGWGGCRFSPPPERLFTEGEELQFRYEKAASQQAIAKYQIAMTTWLQRGNAQAAARAGQRIGATYGQLGSLDKSLASYLEAVSLARQSDDPVLESEIRSDAGIAQTLVSDREQAFDEALRQCEAALGLAGRSGSERARAKALTCLGEVAYYSQRHEDALRFYREAGQLWIKLGDRQGQAQALLYQGYVHSDLSRFDQARTCYESAQSLLAPADDKRAQAIILVADARLKMRQGEYQKALDEFERAQTHLQIMGDAVWEGSALTGIARVYLDMADTGLALKYLEHALQIFEASGLKGIAFEVLIALGETHLVSGDDGMALSRFQRALALADELDIERWRAYALRYIGVTRLFRHQPVEALESLERSLKMQESLGDLKLGGRTIADIGEAHEALGHHKRAVNDFERALSLSTGVGDRVARTRALYGLGRAAMGLGDLEQARRYVEQSLAVAESLRTEVDNRDLRASYVASVYQWHELHMDVLMRLHKRHPRQGLAAAAFEACEQARARSLLESLTEAGVGLRGGLDSDLLRREQRVKLAFDDWSRRRSTASGGKADAAAMNEEYRDLEERYNQIQAEIRSKSPRYAALAKPQPLSLKAVQAQVLDANTVLLEYALGEERSYLWAVSNQDQTSYELPPRAEIEQAAQRVYEHLTTRLNATGEGRDRARRIEDEDAQYWTDARRVSEILLRPVAKKIAGKRILVVADAALQYLPFAALPVPDGQGEPVPLIADHEIVSLPSASVLAVLRQETSGRAAPGKAVAVLADPVFEADDPRLRSAGSVAAPPARTLPRDMGSSIVRLPSTRHEADAIIAGAPAGMTLKAIDFDASRATAMSPALAQYRIVHFATHGVFDNEEPGLSGIILSMYDRQGRPQDGFLRLHDIYGLNLPAELVVLSACNTALGKPVRGEGLVGIVRGFMYAGAKRVVASLWKVDDEATGELMSRFYEAMLRQDRSPASALRQAQLEMWRQDRWRAPYYWAAFVLQGEWK